MSRRKSTAKAKLKTTNQQERIKLWKQHFQNLLGNPPKVTHEPITRVISKQLDIKLVPFTLEELDLVLRKIKNRKAAGLDEECILPFPKKGDLELVKNYRGITLTFIAVKIYNALLRNRIELKIDNILRNQNGFRRNRSTTSQILTISRILEGVRAKSRFFARTPSRIRQCYLSTLKRPLIPFTVGANSTRIRSTKRNRRSHKDSLSKHQSESAFS